MRRYVFSRNLYANLNSETLTNVSKIGENRSNTFEL